MSISKSNVFTLYSFQYQLGIEKEKKLLEKKDIHIHFPAGAVGKDGPSAGVTIATVLVSLFSKKCVRSDVAMTGEITLRGLVLPVRYCVILIVLYDLISISVSKHCIAQTMHYFSARYTYLVYPDVILMQDIHISNDDIYVYFMLFSSRLAGSRRKY